MPYNKRLKIVFIHIPKCAGTSIDKSLDMTTRNDLCYNGSPTTYPFLNKQYVKYFQNEELKSILRRPPQHFSLREVKKILGSFDDYFVFSVVRNPYNKLVSAYLRIRSEWPKIPEFESLAKFVDCFLTLKDGEPQLFYAYNGHVLPQWWYLLNEEKNLQDLDAIYRFENLQECYKKIQEINPGVHLSHSNKGKFDPHSYDSHYTPELRDKVYNYYRKDFELFGYDK